MNQLEFRWSNDRSLVDKINAGHDFEARWIAAIYYALENFRTVTLYYANGDLVTPENFRQKTKGTDLVIEIEAATPGAARQVAGKIRAAIERISNG